MAKLQELHKRVENCRAGIVKDAQERFPALLSDMSDLLDEIGDVENIIVAHGGSIDGYRDELCRMLDRFGYSMPHRRRSQEDLQVGLDRIVNALANQPQGMTAEAIKLFLDMERREVPLLIKFGIDKKVIRKQDKGRFSVYFLRKGS